MGQYVEIEDDTALNLEYGVRGAASAVHQLMRPTDELPGVKKWKRVIRYGNRIGNPKTIHRSF